MTTTYSHPAAPPDLAADDAGIHFSAGLAAHQAGQFEEAFAAYAAAVQHDSRHAGALHHIGILGYQIGNLELALEFLDAAIKAMGSTGCLRGANRCRRSTCSAR